MSYNKELSEQEKRIFQHQISFPDVGNEGQLKIKNASVLVVGAGGKGTAVLQQLAKAGVGVIGITDNYPIEESELPRQSIYGCKDLGKLRAIAVREKIEPINHFVDFQIHNLCLSPDNIQKVATKYDILVDATDNFPARYLINDIAIEQNKPFVYSSLLNSMGMISCFNYKNGPSLRCLYPNAPENKEKPTLNNMYAWGIPLGILGNLVANEVLKIILDKETRLSGSLLKFDFSSYEISYEEIKKNEANFRL